MVRGSEKPGLVTAARPDLDTKDEGRPNRGGAADKATPLSGAKRKKSKQWKRDLGAGAPRAARKKATNKQ
jgi:hypothetical protein